MWGIPEPELPHAGVDCYEMFRKIETGEIKGLLSWSFNPFVSLRTRLSAPEDVPLFRARTTARERWRLMVYDLFDVTTFAPSRNLLGDLVPFQGPMPG